MWPMRSALPGLEEFRLQVHILLLRKLTRSHAHVLYMSDEVAFREASVMHRARVPQHKVAGLQVDLDHLATALLEPLHILLFEDE